MCIHFNLTVYFCRIVLRITLNTLTNSVDFIRQLSSAEGTRVLGDALVKQVDDVAIPASLPTGDKNNNFYISWSSFLVYSQSPNTHTVSTWTTWKHTYCVKPVFYFIVFMF